jgi:hypothetical protein
MKKASSQSRKRSVTADRAVDSLRLDGNAAAGMLSEVFVPDLTAGRAKCAGCGTTRSIGALHVYSHGMGMVVRCPSCDGVILRVARTATRVWLDARGAVSIVISGGN